MFPQHRENPVENEKGAPWLSHPSASIAALVWEQNLPMRLPPVTLAPGWRMPVCDWFTVQAMWV